MASEHRAAEIKELYNALDVHRPFVFEGSGFDPDSKQGGLRPLPPAFFVEDLHKDGWDNPRRALRNAIQYNASAERYFFTGMRGAGKSTELKKLKAELDASGSFVAFYVDMTEYLPLHSAVEIGDFLLAVLSAFADEVDALLSRDGKSVKTLSAASRFWSFLASEIKLDGMEWGVDTIVGKLGFKLKIKENLQFKEALQKATRGQLDRLVEESRAFVNGLVEEVRAYRNDPGLGVILLVDSVERLQGVGEEAKRVFDSVENLFGSHRDKLRFATLSVVYSVPPYIGAVAQAGENNRIFSLPIIHVFQKPDPGAHGEASEEGLTKMLSVIEKRAPRWREYFTEAAMRDLALQSGGDLREWFLLIRECLNLVDPDTDAHFPIPLEAIQQAGKLRRNQFGIIPADHMDWLKRVVATHESGLESLDQLSTFAALLDGKLIYQYRNGVNWYDIHPLLWGTVDQHATAPAGS